MSIPAAFQPYRQFILWRAVPTPGEKTKKKPLSPFTLQPSDPHYTGNWLDYDTAMALATQHKVGVGFVFTEADPFFFLDVDDALHDGAWAPDALDVYNRLFGCAVEVSQSGEGFHIFGVYEDLPPHKITSSVVASCGLALYTKKRFAALTGNSWVGDTNFVVDLGPVIDQYFQPDPAGTARDDEWTFGPCPEWNGPQFDEDLLKIMLRSRSTAAVFGGKATVEDLWYANVDKLAVTFPAKGPNYDFDHSSADQALCNHLAFWTGKDCERIERLFGQSQLVRPKWFDRDAYRRATILDAVSHCNAVFGSNRQQPPPPPPPAGPPGPPPAAGEGSYRMGYQLLTIEQQIEFFKGCVYVRDQHRVFTPDGALLKPEQFRAVFGGYKFMLDTANSDAPTKNAWEAFIESKNYSFPRANSIAFRPELPPGAIIMEEGAPLVNTYVPIQVPRKQGDPSRFLELVEKLIPDIGDRHILLQYMAACVQFPGRKFQWCPIIQGVQGNGKTLLGTCVANAVGWRYTHMPDANDLDNKFNSWMQSKLFIIIEEINVHDKTAVLEALKPLITNMKIPVQGKGVDQVTGDNRANFFMLSNYKTGVRIAGKDRRYCIFYCPQQERVDLARFGLTSQYFGSLWDWCRAEGFAIITEYLHNYPITKEFELQLMYRAPVTTSTDEAIRLSRGGLEQEIDEAIAEGAQGWRGGWISSAAFANLIKQQGQEKRINRNLRKEILKSLGYIPHPGLPDGRVNNRTAIDAGRPVLYVKEGGPLVHLQGASNIVKAYESAQKEVL